jgi:hypothetical protein
MENNMTKEEAKIRDLIMGIGFLAGVFGVIFFVYAYLLGMSQGGDLVLKSGGLEGLLIALIGLSMLAFFAGIDLGRYIEAYLRKEKA